MASLRFISLSLVIAMLAAGLLALVIAANPQSPVRVIRAEAYPLDDSPAAAAAFGGNDAIVLVTVEVVGSPRWNTDDVSASARFIFTPLHVRVDEVLRGNLPEKALIVRHLGGQIDQVRFEYEGLLSDSAVAAGSRLLLFLGPAGDTGDGFVARTPNMSYSIDSEGTATAPEGRHRISLAEFREVVASVEP